MIEFTRTSSFRNVSLSEAKKNLAEIIDQVHKGERIGITRRGKLAAIIIPADSQPSVKQIFHEIEQIRLRTRPHKKMRIKDLIQEGRP